MSGFIKYQHVERVNSTECEGLLDGQCYVFPKIDGTNASVWSNSDGSIIYTGSRNRELSIESDNAGFCNWVVGNLKSKKWDIFEKHPSLHIYGEWLVPHSLKTYRDDAWRDFYVFDVLDKDLGFLLSYEDYKPLLEEFGINYIPPLAKIKNPQEENLFKLLDMNQYLIQDGFGKGEGIVIKNYSFYNKFGRQVWGKIITNEFKEKHHKEMGAPEINNTLFVEELICRDFLTDEFLLKEKAKIENHYGEWSSKYIGEYLGRVFYEFIREETYEFIKAYKNPKINFKFLNQLVIKRAKEVIGV